MLKTVVDIASIQAHRFMTDKAPVKLNTWRVKRALTFLLFHHDHFHTRHKGGLLDFMSRAKLKYVFHFLNVIKFYVYCYLAKISY